MKGGYVPIPIHSNGGEPFDMLFAGNHPEVCPYIKHQVDEYIATDKNYLAKLKEFETNLFPKLDTMFNIPEAQRGDWDLYYNIIDQMYADKFEKRYHPTYDLTPELDA